MACAVLGRRHENSQLPPGIGRRGPKSSRSLESSGNWMVGGWRGGGSDRTSGEPRGPGVLTQLPSTQCETFGEVGGERGPLGLGQLLVGLVQEPLEVGRHEVRPLG